MRRFLSTPVSARRLKEVAAAVMIACLSLLLFTASAAGGRQSRGE